MNTFNIYFLGDLYEIEVSGTLVRKVKKHSLTDGTFRSMEWQDLPEEVQVELVNKVIALHK